MNFIVSDLHFYHQNIIRFDGRPFDTAKEMNEVLVANWNSTVNATDTVYVLGDLFYKAGKEEAETILKQLNGNIIYVYGNHEKALVNNPHLIDTYLSETHTYLEMSYPVNGKGHRLVLSHYPIPMFNGHFGESTTHIYGHVHQTEEQFMTVYQQLMNFTNKNAPRVHKMVNVGVMMNYMGYAPKPVEEVIQKAEEHTDLLYRYFNEECRGVMPTLEEFRKQTHLYKY